MPTPSEIRAFTETGTWSEIVHRLTSAYKQADKQVENPDPYKHGVAVGERNMLRMLLDLPERLIVEQERRR